MRAPAGILALPIVLGLGGCFPSYEFADEPQEVEPLPYMRRSYAEGQTFTFKLNTDINPQETSAHLSYDFDLDMYEVSVRRYKDWLESGAPLPCDDCTLDAGGPYEDAMRWDPSWSTVAKQAHYSLPDCFTPTEYGPWTTYDAPDSDDFPMVCVSWVQAAAFCAWDQKRLPTEVERLYEVTAGGNPVHTYPWGGNQPDCSRATIAGCTFPTNVGTALSGASNAGIQDLTGSVFEWVWDATWDSAADYPGGAKDYSGPKLTTGATSLDRAHFRNGGAYFDPHDEPRLRNDVAERQYAAREYYADAGFRCAKSVR